MSDGWLLLFLVCGAFALAVFLTWLIGKCATYLDAILKENNDE